MSVSFTFALLRHYRTLFWLIQDGRVGNGAVGLQPLLKDFIHLGEEFKILPEFKEKVQLLFSPPSAAKRETSVKVPPLLTFRGENRI